MEIVAELVNHQFVSYVPVVLVLVVAILLFTFGFKSAEQPPFDKLTSSSDDRKLAGKKRKTKEKKTTANGHVTNIDGKVDKSPSKDKKSPTKESPGTPKQKKPDNKQAEKNKPMKIKKPADNIEEIKNKKNRGKVTEKPVDYDDGEWETVPTKADKKKKQEGSPIKKDRRKTKDKSAEIEKLAKEVVNKELREKDIKEKENVEAVVVVDKDAEDVEFVEPKVEIEIVDVVPVEEKKKKEKKPKKEKEVAPPKTEEPVAEQIAEAMAEAPAKPSVPEGGVVFDELGDVWTEAKLPKKSKKKARRDN